MMVFILELGGPILLQIELCSYDMFTNPSPQSNAFHGVVSKVDAEVQARHSALGGGFQEAAE